MGKTSVLIAAMSADVTATERRVISAARAYAAITGDALEIWTAPFADDFDFQAKIAALSAYGLPVNAISSASGCAYAPLAETATAIFQRAIEHASANTALLAADGFGKDFAPRLAVALDASMASDVVGFACEQGECLCLHPMWAGRVMGTLRLKAALKVITVRASAFDAAEPAAKASIAQMNYEAPAAKARIVKKEKSVSERPALTDARIIVSGGRGCQSSAGFTSLICGLADDLGAAVGATRAAVDEGWIANDAQVGQTGKAVAPELYFALGISGAIQHAAGLQNAKCVVAINKDPDAPIFDWADYGLVADLRDAVPELRALLMRFGFER